MDRTFLEISTRINHAGGQTSSDWILSKVRQSADADFTLDGQQLFLPNPKHEGA